MPPVAKFEWFTDWVNQNLGLTLAFTSITSVDRVLDAFRSEPHPGPPLSLDEVEKFSPEPPRIASGPLSARSIELLRQQGATPDEIDALSEGRQRLATGVIRIGQVNRWTAVIEYFTTRATDLDVVCALARSGEEAVVYCNTQTVVSFLYARDGALVSGFDATVPSIRWGSDESYFDDLIAEGGGDTRPLAPADIAQLLQSRFALTIDRGLLEDPLPWATLRA